MNKKIGIVITTFFRNDLLEKSIKSLEIIKQNQNVEIFIVDQNPTEEKLNKYQGPYFYIPVPYNSGLSYARNEGVKYAKDLECDYVIIWSDSFLANESLDKITYLVENQLFGYDLIGFELKGSICGWEAKMDLIPTKAFQLEFIKKEQQFSKHPDFLLLDCELCRNIFIAKTDTLISSPWDNNLKLCFDKNTPILIKNGLNEIQSQPIFTIFPKSVKQNVYWFGKNSKKQIWTHKGWKKIIAISKKITNEKLYSIYTNNAIIKLTENHPLIINDRKVLAKNLKIGNTINIYPYPKLTNNLNVSEDWAWLLGFFLAEGTCLGTSNRIEITNQDVNRLKKCEKIFNNIGIKCEWYSNLSRKDKCHFLRVRTPKLLINYFKSFYIDKEKIIPNFIYDFKKSARISFLKGFWEGDGSKSVKKPLILSQKNPSIINGLIWLTKDIYKNYLVRERTNNLGNWFTLNLKMYKENHASKIIDIKITEVKDEVYDIECEENILCAGIGNVKVHNCEHESFFHEYKQKGYKVGWTNLIVADKMKDRPDEYAELRRINFNNGQKYLKEKYKIKGWVEYINLDEAKKGY